MAPLHSYLNALGLEQEKFYLRSISFGLISSFLLVVPRHRALLLPRQARCRSPPRQLAYGILRAALPVLDQSSPAQPAVCHLSNSGPAGNTPSPSISVDAAYCRLPACHLQRRQPLPDRPPLRSEACNTHRGVRMGACTLAQTSACGWMHMCELMYMYAGM